MNETILEPKNQSPVRHYKAVYLVFLLVIVFFLGVQFGSGRLPVPEPVAKVFLEKNRETAPREVDWQILWDTISEINEKFVNRPADLEKILHGAVSGAVGALGDPYSVFLPPKEAEEFNNELRGNFEGIGAEIAIKNQQLVIVSPLDNSPAIKAGVKAGDYIQKIDGEDTAPFTLEQAVAKIRGPKGSIVTLTILHKSLTKPVEIKITRDKIEVLSLSSEIKEKDGKRIGYIKMRRFGEETDGELQKIVSDLLLQNVQGVILDLRNNPGGYLDVAVDVASHWVDEGQVVVIQKFGDSTEEIYKAKGQNEFKNIPSAVLINGGSASASEIVAGALKDHGLAKIIGEKSFGKGSVQELLDLRGDVKLKLTVAKWLTPSGHDLSGDGLEPDEKVEFKDEDFQADRDPQLDKALEILSASGG